MTHRCALAHPLQAGTTSCPRCHMLYAHGALWAEMVRPLPEAAPPMGPNGQPQCHDCTSADDLVARYTTDDRLRAWMAARRLRFTLEPGPKEDDEDDWDDEDDSKEDDWDDEDGGDRALDLEGDMPDGAGLSWVMARVAVGNDRLEQYRLPGVPMGLAHPSFNLVRTSMPGDLQEIHAWLDAHGIGAEDGGLCR